jgi:hypothetical protein
MIKNMYYAENKKTLRQDNPARCHAKGILFILMRYNDDDIDMSADIKYYLLSGVLPAARQK